MQSLSREDLHLIACRIEKIEAKDPNFQQNPKWKLLRKQQDELFEAFAKQEIKYHKSKVVDNKASTVANSKQKIAYYEEYLRKGEKRENVDV